MLAINGDEWGIAIQSVLFYSQSWMCGDDDDDDDDADDDDDDDDDADDDDHGDDHGYDSNA